ncbi:hypothetical protein [Paraburkholderia sp.]|uniref:pilus assembly PilX family protein n=1 Tax=Paraburkholderia sp. TaxID=1926495 RepID=UPI0023A24F3C|nr:hypothetical protein [Paraburkholderia sp.]MDE1183417.1 hypothetical protein [Paraburkholderia sp.]
MSSRVRPGTTGVRARGAALPIVLLISSMMLTTAAAWFDTSLAAARAARNIAGHVSAFHAADSMLRVCARAVLSGAATVVAGTPGVTTEPVAWKSSATFDSRAVSSFAASSASWPGTAKPPQCVAETWQIAGRPSVRGYLLTARGYGQSEDIQAWLQLQLAVDGDQVERHWRRIASRPF